MPQDSVNYFSCKIIKTDPYLHETHCLVLNPNDMKKEVLLLRLSYWIAAIADFAIAVLAWIPERMGVTEMVYPGGLASVIAFSWGVMLLIADRKPIQRRWILIPTILVVILIMVVRTKFSLDGSIEFSWALFLFAVGLVMLMTYSYYYAAKHVKDSNRESSRS